MSNLANKVIAITGGNSGIGLAIAQAMADHGAHIAIMGRDHQTLAQCEEQIPGCLVHKGDVCQSEDLSSFFQKTYDRWQRLDVVIANAGIAKYTGVEIADKNLVDKVLATNVSGVFFTVQKALPYLKKGGRIILITSGLSQKAAPGFSIYAASKAAVRSLARSFASELEDRGIYVNALSPGATRTPLFGKMDVPEEVKQQQKKRGGTDAIPLQRFADPEEIAQGALFLASDANTYMQGAELCLDGGFAQI